MPDLPDASAALAALDGQLAERRRLIALARTLVPRRRSPHRPPARAEAPAR